jgi:hypothetical protein
MSDFGLSFVAAPEVPETFNVLLYGPPKAGKTTAAATAPGPILWLNLEGSGALGYARKVAAERGNEIHEVRPDRGDDLRAVLMAIARHTDTPDAQPQFRSVVVDTIGKVRDHLARNIGGDHPQIQHWGEVAKFIETFIATMRDRPVNLVLIAHEAIKDSDDGDRVVEPLIGGATTAKVAGEVDVIAYCARLEEDESVRYVGQLVERKGRRAGDRSGGLGVVRDLDVAEWLDAYREALRSEPQDDTEAALFPAAPAAPPAAVPPADTAVPDDGGHPSRDDFFAFRKACDEKNLSETTIGELADDAQVPLGPDLRSRLKVATKAQIMTMIANTEFVDPEPPAGEQQSFAGAPAPSAKPLEGVAA